MLGTRSDTVKPIPHMPDHFSYRPMLISKETNPSQPCRAGGRNFSCMHTVDAADGQNRHPHGLRDARQARQAEAAGQARL